MAKIKCSISVSVDNCVAGHHMTEERPSEAPCLCRRAHSGR